MDFKTLIQKNKNNVKNIIRLIVKEDNEDIEQEVYIKVFKNAGKYDKSKNFKNWINTIAKNTSKDYLKSAYKKHEEPSDDTAFLTLKDKKETPELKVINNERQQKIIKAINSLKPKLKEVIILCEIQGYTYEECAQKLKCPVGTIKSRIYNAKKELADKLQDLMKG